MVCDFCNAPNPVWRFQARPFLVDYGAMAGASDAGWAACDACRDMILANDRNGLVDRAMLIAPAIPDLAESDVKELPPLVAGSLFQAPRISRSGANCIVERAFRWRSGHHVPLSFPVRPTAYPSFATLQKPLLRVV